MPIHLACQSCHRSLVAPDHLAGRSARCPSCKFQTPIPDQAVHAVAPIDVADKDLAEVPQETQPGTDPFWKPPTFVWWAAGLFVLMMLGVAFAPKDGSGRGSSQPPPPPPTRPRLQDSTPLPAFREANILDQVVYAERWLEARGIPNVNKKARALAELLHQFGQAGDAAGYTLDSAASLLIKVLD